MAQPTQQSAAVTAGNDAKASDYNKVNTDITNIFAGWMPLFGAGAGIVGTPPAANPAMFLMQGATNVVNTNVNGDATIFFPVAFPNGVLTVVIVNGNANGNGNAVGVWDSSNATTGFSIRSGARSVPIRVNWIAIGW